MSLYAGFDCSTQSLTTVVIDSRSGGVVFRDSVLFDEPFIASENSRVVHTRPAVWASALETSLGRLAAAVDSGRLAAIAGAAQQHGTVYCGPTPSTFTRQVAPIWMDSSTERECTGIEAALGGPAASARLTGSRVYPRFSGPQIRRFARESPADYARTDRIHLVSSFMASLLLGQHAPIDHADGSGMALMDLATRGWSGAAMEATAPGLAAKLPALVSSGTIIGMLHSKWQERFSLPPARLTAWTGDNPASMIGLGLVREGQLAISLGTSDTIFGPMATPRVSDDGIGHVFASPLGAYMGITVFRNGSRARERVMERCGLSWAGFDDALRRTPPGNDGAMMLPWFEPEITPHVPRGSPASRALRPDDRQRHVRAIVEGQAMAMLRHSSWTGVTPNVVHATGGGSQSAEILQVFANVFGAPVVSLAIADSAAIGAALLAWHADAREDWDTIAASTLTHLAVGTLPPDPAAAAVYRELREAYADFEREQLARIPDRLN